MSDLPLACTLTADEFACGAAKLLPGLAAAARVVWADGDCARLEFGAEVGVVTRIAAVIERERQCCRFLSFRVDVPAGTDPVTLVVSGPAGTGAFLAGLHPAFARRAS